MDKAEVDESQATATIPMALYLELREGFREVVKVETKEISVVRHTGAGRGLAVGLSVLSCAAAAAVMLHYGVGWGWYFLPFFIALGALSSISD
jgi:hypothetical protein